MHARRIKITCKLTFSGLGNYTRKGLLKNHGSEYYWYFRQVIALRKGVGRISITIWYDCIPALSVPKYGTLFSLVVRRKRPSGGNAELYKVNRITLGNHTLEKNNCFCTKAAVAAPAWQRWPPRATTLVSKSSSIEESLAKKAPLTPRIGAKRVTCRWLQRRRATRGWNLGAAVSSVWASSSDARRFKRAADIETSCVACRQSYGCEQWGLSKACRSYF